jgi:hypothetical protein
MKILIGQDRPTEMTFRRQRNHGKTVEIFNDYLVIRSCNNNSDDLSVNFNVFPLFAFKSISFMSFLSDNGPVSRNRK